MVAIETKERIIDMYYNQHEKPSKIAEELNIRPSYVTKIIQKDMRRYNAEKEFRAKLQKEKRKQYKADWIANKRNFSKELDEFMKMQHRQAAEELSYKPEISDEAFVKWNRSIYKSSGKRKRFEIDRKITVSSDVPKYVNTNWKIPTQKYVKVMRY